MAKRKPLVNLKEGETENSFSLHVLHVPLTKIVTEMTIRITIYRDRGAYVLFVVYDTDDFILNGEEFIGDLEKHEKIKAVVVR
jgi:hypothetical protein